MFTSQKFEYEQHVAGQERDKTSSFIRRGLAITHLDKDRRFREDLGKSLIHNQSHNLLRGHHHLIVLPLVFDSIGNRGAGIPRICIETYKK